MLLSFADNSINIDSLKGIIASEKKNLRDDRDYFNIVHSEKLQLEDEKSKLLDKLLTTMTKIKELTNEMVRIDTHMNKTVEMIVNRQKDIEQRKLEKARLKQEQMDAEQSEANDTIEE